MTDTKLPDVSEFQSGPSTPDWSGIKHQNGGAGICRVGYGTSHLDRMFVANYTAMKHLEFPFIGLYQYIVAGQDIGAQARSFCNWVGPPSAVHPGTVFMCDLEEGVGNQASRANAWFAAVDHFYGLDAQPLPVRSWLYAGASFAVSAGMAGIFSSQRRTWVASYGAHEPQLGHTLWQSTDGQVGSSITAWAGCGRIDTSIYHGTLAQLASMGWKHFGTPPVVKPPAPPPADRRYHGEWACQGQGSLAQLATQLGYPTNTLLRMTAVHFGYYDSILATWLNDVLTGAKPSTTPVPKGAKLWCN